MWLISGIAAGRGGPPPFIEKEKHAVTGPLLTFHLCVVQKWLRVGASGPLFGWATGLDTKKPSAAPFAFSKG